MVTESERRMLFFKWETLAEMLCRVSKIQKDQQEAAIQLDPNQVPQELTPLFGILDRETVENAWKSGCARADLLPGISNGDILSGVASSAFSIGLSVTAGDPPKPSTPLSVIFGAFFSLYQSASTERDQFRALLDQQISSRPTPPPAASPAPPPAPPLEE